MLRIVALAGLALLSACAEADGYAAYDSGPRYSTYGGYGYRPPPIWGPAYVPAPAPYWGGPAWRQQGGGWAAPPPRPAAPPPAAAPRMPPPPAPVAPVGGGPSRLPGPGPFQEPRTGGANTP